MHYRRVKKHGDHSVGRPNWGPTCTTEGCERPTHQAGMCGTHYHRHWIDNGDGHLRIAAASARRRARFLASEEIEAQLSWRKLWRDGERTCYLCGNRCDPDDYTYSDDRLGRPHKYCGPTHPSLDHVQALANGGTHQRSNVRMACLRCNVAKGAKVHGYEAEHQAAADRP